ncbi:MAG: phospholipase D-like domain-containing protein [Myxococcota bacterium]|jgi:cardiolipin synthase|nr:phospholipase D-like domain-containing protein [Myxococcota bacterium]
MSDAWAPFLESDASGMVDAALILVSVLTAGHVLLNKRSARPAAMWVAICLLVPGAGALLYWMFGYNRISTRADALRAAWPSLREAAGAWAARGGEGAADGVPEQLRDQAEVGARITGRAMLPGHSLHLLQNAAEAYPPMLEAIRSARARVYLSTYIFDRDADGLAFVEALGEAVERGVDVKVLVDGLGEWYSPRRVGSALEAAGVSVQRFLPASIFPPSLYVNLRYHRKLLVVDGERAFTGGMNIGSRHRVEAGRGVRDLQFEVRGPVVAEIEMQFLEDWCFTTGEPPEGLLPPGPSEIASEGNAWVRTVSSGPNEDLETVRWILLGAISHARHSVRIMTPYFIAEAGLVAALNAAALRGVEVEIVLPEHNNLFYMNWAANAQLWQILAFGVRVYRQRGPFNHTKLVLIDDAYALVGSSNLDPRSLRLNFEFNLEVCGGDFIDEASEHYAEARAQAREITLYELRVRPLWVRLRDATASLFSPYL